MLRRKKNFLTLLEISIAIFLLGILLSSLWSMYHRWMVTYQTQQTKQMQVHKILFLKQRLEQISEYMSGAPSDKENTLFTPKEKSEGFQTVCFSYQNAPDADPSFNGRVWSLIYLGPHKKLYLATWGYEEKTRVDVLLDFVDSLSFSYFDPQTNIWREDWPDSFEHLPLWMRLKLNEKDPINLLFRIQHSLEPILYLDKKR
jgi:hypothetical protein